MDLLHAHNRDRKAEGARGFWSSLTLLLGTTVVGASLITSPVTVQAASTHEESAQVAALRAKTESQARQIDALERLFKDACYAGDHTCGERTQFWPVSAATDSPDNPRPSTREVRTTTHTVVQPAKPEPTKIPTAAPLPTQAVDDAVKDTTDTVKDTVDSLVGSVVEATSK